MLRVQSLSSEFHTDHGVVRAVDGVSFEVGRGEIVGIVGESGCGKSATSLSIMRLLPKPHGQTTGGRILLDGSDLLKLDERDMRGIRGNRIAMIFQDPMSSLNPYLRVAEQLVEVAEFTWAWAESRHSNEPSLYWIAWGCPTQSTGCTTFLTNSRGGCVSV